MTHLTIPQTILNELENTKFTLDDIIKIYNPKYNFKSATPDQIKHISNIQELYDWTIVLLKDYFEGRYTERLLTMPNKDSEFFENYRETYLTLYKWSQKTIIWKPLQLEYFKSLPCKIKEPGMLLQGILIDRFIKYLKPCILIIGDEGSKFQSRDFYNKHQTRFNNKPTKKDYKKFCKEHFYEACLRAVVKKESKRNSCLADEINAYIDLENTVEDSLMNECHPSYGIQGYKWSLGYKTPLRQDK